MEAEVERTPQVISTRLKANGSPAIQPDTEETFGSFFKELLEVTFIGIVHIVHILYMHMYMITCSLLSGNCSIKFTGTCCSDSAHEYTTS